MSGPSRIRTAFRGFSVSTGLRVARLLVSLVLTGFLARHLSTDGFGQLMASLAVVSVLLCASELGFNRITVRELVKDKSALPATLGATFCSRLIFGALLYLALIVWVWLAEPEHGPLLLIYGSLLLTHAGTEVMAWFEAERAIERVAVAQFVGFAVSAACIAVGLVMDAPLWFFALTYNIECWFALAVVVVAFRRSVPPQAGRWRWSWPRAVELMKESRFELATQLALLMLFRVDTVMVEALSGKDEAGIYGAAVRVSEVVYFIPVLLSGVCLPALLELRKTDLPRYHTRFADYFALTLLISVPCAALLALASPWVVALLFGAKFAASAPVLAVQAWSFIPYALGVARTQYLTAEGRLWVNLPGVVLALIINVGLNWLWIPQHGSMGAAWATLIAYSVAWVLSSFTLPAARDVARLIVQSIVQMPDFIGQSWRRMRAALPGPLRG